MVIFRKSPISACCVLALLFIAYSQDVYAYVDPGTGSYLIQIVVAGLLGLIYALRLYWTKLKSFLTSKILRQSKKNH